MAIHPAALEEADSAVTWYARRSRRAAGMFLDELDRAIDQIRQNREQYSPDEFSARRLVLRRFPFAIVFRRVAAGVEIIAIAHGRRRPGYWRERLG